MLGVLCVCARAPGLSKSWLAASCWLQLDDDLALPANKRHRQEGLSVMDVDNAGMYRPKTRETREAYEALLAVIHHQFGDQPQVCFVLLLDPHSDFTYICTATSQL